VTNEKRKSFLLPLILRERKPPSAEREARNDSLGKDYHTKRNDELAMTLLFIVTPEWFYQGSVFLKVWMPDRRFQA